MKQKWIPIGIFSLIIALGHGAIALRVGGYLGFMTAFSGLAVIAVLPIVYDLGVTSRRRSSKTLDELGYLKGTFVKRDGSRGDTYGPY